jgi:hypothetical protein
MTSVFGFPVGKAPISLVTKLASELIDNVKKVLILFVEDTINTYLWISMSKTPATRSMRGPTRT